MHDLNRSATRLQTHHMPQPKCTFSVDHQIEDNIYHLAHTPTNHFLRLKILKSTWWRKKL